MWTIFFVLCSRPLFYIFPEVIPFNFPQIGHTALLKPLPISANQSYPILPPTGPNQFVQVTGKSVQGKENPTK